MRRAATKRLASKAARLARGGLPALTAATLAALGLPVIASADPGPTAMITSPVTCNPASGGAGCGKVSIDFVNQTVPTSFSCATAPGGPPIASCTDSNGASSPGGQLDTSNPGIFTYTVTATDTDGQTGTVSVTYLVEATFLGFLPPLPTTKPVNSHATIPVKFRLGDYNGALLSDAAAQAAPTMVTLSPYSNGTDPVAGVSCVYTTAGAFFQCDLKPPPGVNTGMANPYYITAYEQLGGGFVRIFRVPNQPTTNPAVVYFK